MRMKEGELVSNESNSEAMSKIKTYQTQSVHHNKRKSHAICVNCNRRSSLTIHTYKK